MFREINTKKKSSYLRRREHLPYIIIHIFVF